MTEKKLTKYNRVAGYLEQIFRAINAEFFNNEIEEPVISIQNTASAYGHVSVYKIWTVGEAQKRELNIDAGTINRPIEEIVATLVHEMTHLWNLEKDIKDTSNNGVYHNRKFKERAEQTGLVTIEKHEKYGWTKTTPTMALIEWCIANGLQEIEIRCFPFNFGRAGGGENGKNRGKATADGQPEKRKSSTRKYVCPKCGQSVRATKDVNIICGDCMVKMEKAD